MKENKISKIFSIFKKQKNTSNVENVQNVEEKNGDISLINEKQKMDFVKNKDNEVNNIDLLKDLSLSELSFLERELSFKYDILDYKILHIERNNEFLKVDCEITDIQNQKGIITEKIAYKEIKEDFSI